MRAAVTALALAGIAAAACARRSPAPTPATVISCAVPGFGSPERPWRAARGAGFTYCVPADWRPSRSAKRGVDANTWYGDGGSVAWQVGQVPPVVVVRNRIGGSIPPVPGLREQVESRLPGCREPDISVEVIDERQASVTSLVCQGQDQGRFQTIVVWEWPVLRFRAEANRASTAELQRLVYRTVRFSRPSQ